MTNYHKHHASVRLNWNECIVTPESFHFALHCLETEIRLLAALVFDEGKQRHLGDWRGREPNASNVTHTVTINLSFANPHAMTYKPVSLNNYQLTEANADDKYAQKERQQKVTHTLLANWDMIHKREKRKKREK